MARDEPGDDEDAEGDVAEGLVSGVLEELGRLGEYVSNALGGRELWQDSILTGKTRSTTSMRHRMVLPTFVW